MAVASFYINLVGRRVLYNGCLCFHKLVDFDMRY